MFEEWAGGTAVEASVPEGDVGDTPGAGGRVRGGKRLE